MPRTAINFDDNGGNVTTPVLRNELRLWEQLGSGAFGVAYRATFRARPLVVKLPATLLKNSPPSFDAVSHPQGLTLAEVMQTPDQIHPRDLRDARKALRDECENAEQVLNSDVERFTRASHLETPGINVVGASMLRAYMSDTERTIVESASRHHQALPGYTHMHPIVHFDAEIPLLLSEPAEGTLEGILTVLEDNRPLSNQWLETALQLSDAIAFLRDHIQWAHLDLKPDNVLYTHLPTTGRLHIWVGDYGQMAPMDAPTTFRFGAPGYKPDARLGLRMQQRNATCDQQQLFAYYATMLDLFQFPTANNFRTRLLDIDLVSIALPRMIKTRGTLFTYASAELFQHFMVPLLEPSVYVLDVLFERTRAWLRSVVPRP
jgi:serine/threonine protein kinase